MMPVSTTSAKTLQLSQKCKFPDQTFFCCNGKRKPQTNSLFVFNFWSNAFWDKWKKFEAWGTLSNNKI